MHFRSHLILEILAYSRLATSDTCLRAASHVMPRPMVARYFHYSHCKDVTKLSDGHRYRHVCSPQMPGIVGADRQASCHTHLSTLCRNDMVTVLKPAFARRLSSLSFICMQPPDFVCLNCADSRRPVTVISRGCAGRALKSARQLRTCGAFICFQQGFYSEMLCHQPCSLMASRMPFMSAALAR